MLLFKTSPCLPVFSALSICCRPPDTPLGPHHNKHLLKAHQRAHHNMKKSPRPKQFSPRTSIPLYHSFGAVSRIFPFFWVQCLTTFFADWQISFVPFKKRTPHPHRKKIETKLKGWQSAGHSDRSMSVLDARDFCGLEIWRVFPLQFRYRVLMSLASCGKIGSML